jgi:hypothetical protein
MNYLRKMFFLKYILIFVKLDKICKIVSIFIQI